MYSTIQSTLDPVYRAGIIQPTNHHPQPYNKNSIHPIANLSTLQNGSSSFYNAVINQNSQSQANFYNNNNNNHNVRGTNYRTRYTPHHQQQHQQQQHQHQQHQQHPQHPQHQQHHQQQQQQHSSNRHGGYQLKVGGIVVGSWAGGAPNRNGNAMHARINRTNLRNRSNVNIRLQRNLGHLPQVSSLARIISRNTYGIKTMRTRNRRNRRERRGSKPTIKFANPISEVEPKHSTVEKENYADETNERDSSTPNG